MAETKITLDKIKEVLEFRKVHSCVETAKYFGVCQSRISQICKKHSKLAQDASINIRNNQIKHETEGENSSPYDTIEKGRCYEALRIYLQKNSIKNAITLPGISKHTFYFEKLLIEDHSELEKVICIEKHTGRYAKLLEMYKELPEDIKNKIELKNDTIENFLFHKERSKETFDFIWADFIGNTMIQLGTLANNILNPNGIITITEHFVRRNGGIYFDCPELKLEYQLKYGHCNYELFKIFRR